MYKLYYLYIRKYLCYYVQIKLKDCSDYESCENCIGFGNLRNDNNDLIWNIIFINRNFI